MLVLQQTAVGPPPLPGGVAAVLRFFFNLPQWFQIGGFFVGLAVAAWLIVYVWRRRLLIVGWIKTRQRGVKIALVSVAAVAVLGGTGVGTVSWNYMQHDNAFCTGCHIMKVPFQRFTGSKHDSLSCHSCHQQSIFASMRQLYLWVADRPQSIKMHAKVPTPVCAACHVQGDKEKEKWKRIATTAGHRVHLESDSSALRNVQCTTCHGLEVHRFVPADSTCGQSGCHSNVQIRLGKMAGQTGFHCIACHQFTAEVPLLATRDSAAGTLRPGAHECFSCHQMREKLADFDPSRDPHRQTCGMCHNPHQQTRPADALKSCASAGCHVDWRDEPFHTGQPHSRVAQQCELCHQPHAASVDASDCAGCHAAVKQRTHGHVNPPQAFDTTRALRRVSFNAIPDVELKGKGDANPPRAAPASRLPTPADSFSHDRHKQLACLTCHVTRQPNASLTFAPPRGCQICHHQTPAASDCAKCHTPDQLAPAHAETVAVAVANHAARARAVAFSHTTHSQLRCTRCHTTAVSLDPADSVKGCAACHDDHHGPRRDCASCHTGADIQAAHRDSVDTHAACDACHREATVARLVPDRGLCITCHAKQRDHYAARECTACHFLATPDEYRAHLRKVGGA
ncbi:MAG TPA: cytochrome c3 family protein [Gemmatimonadales bacterium]|nr:cytochrome c3 family protein [Gemmatimonadales bacterium]